MIKKYSQKSPQLSTITQTYYYDAFGNILSQTGTFNNQFTYSGYQYDKESGKYYLLARFYDPLTARFMSEDTYTGQVNDPLSLNLYVYCHNEPIIYSDPSGYTAESNTYYLSSSCFDPMWNDFYNNSIRIGYCSSFAQKYAPEIQKMLISLGIMSNIAYADFGWYGNKTVQAVKDFQWEYELSPISGITGPTTLNRLIYKYRDHLAKCHNTGKDRFELWKTFNSRENKLFPPVNTPLSSSRQLAVNWAIKFANNTKNHDNFYYFNGDSEGSDCANFVSQCLYAGGIHISQNWNWWGYVYVPVYNKYKFDCTPSWIKADAQFRYFIKAENSNGASWYRKLDDLSRIANEVLPGDIISFCGNSDGFINHAGIVSSIQSDGIHMCAHTNPRLDEPLAQVILKEGYEGQIYFIRVKYPT